MTISVIIATFNRAALLAECLQHLRRQPFEEGDEVIVVDNGSTDETYPTVSRATPGFRVPLRYLREPTPGKSVAVGRAVAASSADVLAFTDDDVNVEDGWLDAIRCAMADPDVALVGGPVAPRWERQPPRWLRAAAENGGRLAAPLALLDYGRERCELGPKTAIGANLAVRRGDFLAAGGFAPHLGKLRGTLLSGEDQELCRRIQAAGRRAVYIPSARVRHFVPAARMHVPYYLSWFFWSGITNAALESERPPAGRTLWGVPWYLLRRMAGAGVGAVASAACGNAARALERGIDIAFTAGYAARRWRLPIARTATIGEGRQ